MACEWKSANLGEICELSMGETIIAKDLTGDGIPVFSAGKSIDPWGYTSRSKRRFNRGTVILSARGTIGYPRLPTYDEFVSTQTTIAAIPKAEILSEFLTYALARNDFESFTAKQAIPMLTISALREMSVPLPPLPEQRKIAEILSSVDDAIEKSSAVIDQLEVVKKALMQELLTRGLPGRHTCFKQTENGEIPEEWEITKLYDIGQWLSGGTPSKSSPKYWDGSIPWVSPKDMKVLRISNAIDHVSESAIGNGTRLVPAQSIFIVVRGMILAHSFPVALTTRPMAFNQDIKALIPSQKFIPEYILYWLANHRDVVLQLVSDSSHGTKRLPTEAFFELPVKVPQLSEQQDVVNLLSSIDMSIHESFALLHNLRLIKSSLLSTLLSGEVRVPIDKDAA